MWTSLSIPRLLPLLPLLLSVLYINWKHQQSIDTSSLDAIGWTVHHEKVEAISKDIADYMKQSDSKSNESRTKCVSISQRKHGSTTRSTEYKSHCHSVDVGSLHSVIALDAVHQTAWIESNLNMEQIYDALSQHGFALKVVPEFKHITIGGAIQGYGIESTSINHGFLHSTATAYHVVLLNEEATVLTVDEQTHNELFHILPGSWNTIGLIVAVQVEIMELPLSEDGVYWMDIEYRLAMDRQSMLDTVHSLYRDNDIDSVECLRIEGMENVFVVAIGTLVAAPNHTVFSMHYWWHHFYHFHVFHDVVDQSASTLIVDRESIELKQFLFRHDRGAFWVIYDDPAMWFLRHFTVMRFLFGYMLTAKDLYRFRNVYLDELQKEFDFVVRDYIVPFEVADRFLGEIVDHHFGTNSILWICPVVDDDIFFVNIGVYLTLYDRHCADWTECVSMYRNLEMETVQSGGRNWFYAPSFLEKAEFERLHAENGRFDYTLYRSVRQQYDIATVDLYDKIGTIGSRDDLYRIQKSRPKYKYLSHFPVAIQYAAWWVSNAMKQMWIDGFLT